MKRLFSPKEAAAYCAVSCGVIYEAIAHGRLKAKRPRDPQTGQPMRRIVIECEELDRWIDTEFVAVAESKLERVK